MFAVCLGASILVAAEPGRVSDAEFAPRRSEALRAVAARPLRLGSNPTTWVDEERWCVAHARLATDADAEALAQANQYLAEVEWVSLWRGLVADTDIQVTDLLRTWFEFNADARLTPAARDHLRSLFAEWEPPNRDRNRFAERTYDWPAEYTENHSLNILTAAYLIDTILERDRGLRRELLQRFLYDRARWGWSEFYSPSYAIYTAKPLSLLADFAPDQELRESAVMMLDLMALEFAIHGLGHWRGMPFARGSSAGIDNRRNAMFGLSRHWFGDRDPDARYTGGTALVHLLTSGYRPPAMAARLIHDLNTRGSYTIRQTATHGPAKERIPIVVAVTPNITMASAVGSGSYYDGHYWSISFAEDPRQVITGRYGKQRTLLQIDRVLAVFGTAEWHGPLAHQPLDLGGNLPQGRWTSQGSDRIIQLDIAPDLHLFVLEHNQPEAGLADRMQAMNVVWEDGTLAWTDPDGRRTRMVNRRHADRWEMVGAWIDDELYRLDHGYLHDSPFMRSKRDSARFDWRDGIEGWRYDLSDPTAPAIHSIPDSPLPTLPPERIAGPLGMQFLRIPAGEYPAGARADEGRAGDPPFEWIHTDAFYMAQTETTVAQYRAFLAAHPDRPGLPEWYYAEWGKTDDYPQTLVSWHDAKAFCDWLTAHHPGRYRLPTQVEWEKAARGWQYRVYPWGDDYDGSQAGTPNGEYAPVGTHPIDRSPFDILDMAGNAWEWCSDPYPNPDGDAWRFLRGCAWNFDPDTFRIAYRSGWNETERSPHIGFRIVHQPDE